MILGFWKDKNVEIHMKETNEIISGKVKDRGAKHIQLYNTGWIWYDDINFVDNLDTKDKTYFDKNGKVLKIINSNSKIINSSNEPSLNHIDCGDEYC